MQYLEPMEEKFHQRIEYTGELEDFLPGVCQDYDIGSFIKRKIVMTGYEDLNLILETTKGKYFVKIFAKFRDLANCKRYNDIMLKALDIGVQHPQLLKSNQGYLHILKLDKGEVRLSIMEYIEGDSFFNTGEKPTKEHIKFIANQAALINSIDVKPSHVYDSWAIINFIKEFEKLKPHLTDEDLQYIQPLADAFKKLDIQKLPHCFVHGDLIKTNIMKDNNDQLWVFDFSVGNRYPRIQEFAVLACNFLFDEHSKEASEENLRLALEEYQKTIKLTSEELQTLPLYIKAAHAMHVIGATKDKVEHNNLSDENMYWLEQGRLGLRQTANLERI